MAVQLGRCGHAGQCPHLETAQFSGIRLFVLVGLLVVLIAVSSGCASTVKPMETAEPVSESFPVQGTAGQVVIEQ